MLQEEPYQEAYAQDDSLVSAGGETELSQQVSMPSCTSENSQDLQAPKGLVPGSPTITTAHNVQVGALLIPQWLSSQFFSSLFGNFVWHSICISGCISFLFWKVTDSKLSATSMGLNVALVQGAYFGGRDQTTFGGIPDSPFASLGNALGSSSRSGNTFTVTSNAGFPQQGAAITTGVTLR